MSGGVSGDMHLPPQFQMDPEAMASLSEAVAEEASAETNEAEGNEGKAGRAGAKKEATKSEKSSTTTNVSGDVIIAGVGGFGSDTGGGSSGGRGGSPSQPELAGVGEATNASLEEVTSAMIAAIYALVMSEAAFAAADYQSGETMLNQLYQNLDRSIDTTNSNIMRAKLAEAKEKRIEAEKKASGLGGAIAGLMGGLGLGSAIILQIIGALLLPVGIGVVFMAASVLVLCASIIAIGLIASGGMQEGGICGSMATMLGMEDTAMGRMVVLLIFSVLTCNICFLILALGPCWAGMEAVEKEEQAAKDCLNISLVRDTAKNTPAEMKKMLEENGMEDEMAEIMAYIMVLLMLLMAMLGGATGGGALAAGGSAAGGAGGAQGGSGTGEGASMGEGSVDGGMGEASMDGMSEAPSPSEGMGGEMDGAFGDFSQSGPGNSRAKVRSANPSNAQVQSTIAESKNLAGQFDMQKMFTALRDILESEFDWPESATRSPEMEMLTQDLDQFAEMVISGISLTYLQAEPTMSYVGSLMEEDPTKDLGLTVNTRGMG